MATKLKETEYLTPEIDQTSDFTTIAGAANYWYRRASKAEKAVRNNTYSFLAGTLYGALIAALVWMLLQ